MVDKPKLIVPVTPRHPPCIFCGSPGKTAEDAWPKWLLKRLKKQLGGPTIIDWEFDHQPRRPRYSIRIEGFCEKTCNNGWMRRLENETIPVLSPMFLGQAVDLASTHQLTLATWAVVRAVVFDCLRPPRHHDSRDTTHLLTHLTPPASTFGVWLGYCLHPLAFTEGKRLTKNAVLGSGIDEGYVLTMVFGHVVLQVLTLRKPQSHPIATVSVDVESGPWDDALTPIWPLGLRPVKWPPKLAFDPSAGGLPFLANRFNTTRR